MAIVYLNKRKDNNEVFYVGIGKDKNRPYSKDSRSIFWKNYTSKHAYFVEVLTSELTWEEACEIEKELICFYGRRDLGFGELVNLTDGGEGVCNMIVSQKTKNKISLGNMGNTSRRGKKMSKEAIAKISKATKGRKTTLETKIKKSVPVIQYDLQGSFIAEYYGAKEASDVTGVDHSLIIKVCKNKRKMGSGYKWKYKNE